MSDIVEKLADKLVSELGEHCDSVRVFCTMNEGNGETASYTVGDGNFHAQTGQVKEWLIRQDEIVREHARKNNDDDKS